METKPTSSNVLPLPLLQWTHYPVSDGYRPHLWYDIVGGGCQSNYTDCIDYSTFLDIFCFFFLYTWMNSLNLHTINFYWSELKTRTWNLSLCTLLLKIKMCCWTKRETIYIGKLHFTQTIIIIKIIIMHLVKCTHLNLIYF